MQHFFTDDAGPDARALFLVAKSELKEWLGQAPPDTARWVRESGFEAEFGKSLIIPGQGCRIAGAVVGLGRERPGLAAAAAAAATVPAGNYRLAATGELAATECAVGWAMGQYAFDRYKGKRDRDARVLEWPDGADRDHALQAAAADALVRDLVNTPAEDMGPEELEQAARDLADELGGDVSSTVGDALLEKGFPAIHAVGRAASREPRLIDLRWGKGPRVTLVGKGVCFDSGGLNIKPGAGMRLMKKDMGGAAHVLGLARMIMAADLPVSLRVLVPAVENSISGNAYRPGDVIPTRKGISVEIGNTDAEGRMVLCDALALADEEAPELLVDMATLTGAARVALGPDLPAFYCADEDLAGRALALGAELEDPLWRMPLWDPYDDDLSSDVADVNHIAENAFAGSIYAALFLRRFVEDADAWAHLDLFAWNPGAKAGRPRGARCQAVRGMFALIRERYAGD